MKVLKTYNQLIENNKTIRYISDGHYMCPVCGNGLYTSTEENIKTNTCISCGFKWKSIYENSQYSEAFVGDYWDAITDGKEQNIIKGEKISEYILKKTPLINKYNPSKIYLNNGFSVKCPYCNDSDTNMYDEDYNGAERSKKYECNKCNGAWNYVDVSKFKISKDINDKNIVVGDIVDNKLFNIDIYTKVKNNKLKNKYKI